MPPRFVPPPPDTPTDRSVNPGNCPRPREPIGITGAAAGPHLVALQQIADENAGHIVFTGDKYYSLRANAVGTLRE